MNRRAFLLGTAAALAVPAVPTVRGGFGATAVALKNEAASIFPGMVTYARSPMMYFSNRALYEITFCEVQDCWSWAKVIGDYVGADGKRWAVDRFGWVPAVLNWSGWTGQTIEVGGVLRDDTGEWLVKRVDRDANYLGLQPLFARAPVVVDDAQSPSNPAPPGTRETEMAGLVDRSEP